MIKEYKLRLFHLWLLHNVVEQLFNAMIEVEKSGMPGRAKMTIWGSTNEQVIVKAVSFFKEWNRMKRKWNFLPAECIKEVDEKISEIQGIWPHLEKYRSEIAVHPYGEGPTTNPPSVFENGIAYYDIPFSITETMSLMNRFMELVPIVSKYFPAEMIEFNEGKYPGEQSGPPALNQISIGELIEMREKQRQEVLRYSPKP